MKLESRGEKRAAPISCKKKEHWVEEMHLISNVQKRVLRIFYTQLQRERNFADGQEAIDAFCG